MRRFRVNFGNGQVSETMTLADAQWLLARQTDYAGFMYIQVCVGDGEWRRAKLLG